MSSTISFDATREALGVLEDAVTRPLPSRRRRSLRFRCTACRQTFFRTRLSAHRCPHCHSDVIVEVVA